MAARQPAGIAISPRTCHLALNAAVASCMAWIVVFAGLSPNTRAMPLEEGSPAVLVTDSRMTRMVALAAHGSACNASDDKKYIRRVVPEAPRHMVVEMSDMGMEMLMAECKKLRRGPQRPGMGLIFPGTKWCGPGNVATGDHDLGQLEAEDSCCREHDKCPSQLSRGECRSGLCNTTPFTVSHCNCDARFRRCLQTVNSDASVVIGTLYFNVGQMQCFKERWPCPENTEETDPVLCLQELVLRPSGRYAPLPPIF